MGVREDEPTGVLPLARALEAARAEIAALRRTVETQRMLLEGAPDPIFAFTPDCTYSYANEALAEAFGVPVAEILGKRIEDFFPKEEADRRNAKLREVLRTGETSVIEGLVPRPGGRRFFQTSIRPVVDASGRIAAAICTSRDLTARRAVEAELFELQARLDVALDLAGLAYWEMRSATHSYSFNDRFYRLYGTTAEREGGYEMPVEVYAREFLLPGEEHLISECVSRLAAGELEVFETEHRIRRRDGELRDMSVRVELVRDPQGQVVGTRGCNQDVTERRNAEQASAQNHELLAKLAALVPGVIYQYRLHPDGRSRSPTRARE